MLTLASRGKPRPTDAREIKAMVEEGFRIIPESDSGVERLFLMDPSDCLQMLAIERDPEGRMFKTPVRLVPD